MRLRDVIKSLLSSVFNLLLDGWAVNDINDSFSGVFVSVQQSQTKSFMSWQVHQTNDSVLQRQKAEILFKRRERLDFRSIQDQWV